METLLTGLRALDLTDETGYFCGQVLARLGVEVIKVERPGGDAGRLIGPFYGDVPDKERSINWYAGNATKKGITLNVEDERGRLLFKRLAAGADFVVESFAPGYLDSLGLGYARLSEVNPGLIMTSITPFGDDGPYRDYVATDLVVNALAGVMSLIGPMSGPPSRMAGDLSYAMGGGHAALGTLVAYYQRELTGKGQHVREHLMESLIQVFYRATSMWDNDGICFLREDYFSDAAGRVTKEGGLPNLWDCQDGRVFFTIDFSLPKSLVAPAALVQWMRDDGYDAGELGEVDWDHFDPGTLTEARKQAWAATISGFFAGHTMQELFEQGMARKLGPVPILKVSDTLEHEQLAARGYWREVEHADLGRSVRYPGHLFLASETENARPARAPHAGEHNAVVYGQELGLSADEMASLREAHVI
jgi:crotonobetainyl-CoA:carnitine CoA-transferase CaiB-like acyl-CoA transferase